MRRQNVKPCDVRNGRFQQPRRVGRVQQDDIKGLPQGLQKLHGIPGDHPGPVLELRDLQIFLDELHGVGPAVHKHGRGRAPAEALDAQLARAGKEVQDLSPLNLELQGAEHALLDPVRGGAGLHPLQFFQAAAPGGACDNAHGGLSFSLVPQRRRR